MNDTHSSLSDNQQVLLFPTFVYHDDVDNEWKAPINGFVFSPGRDNIRQRMFLKLVQQVLGMDEESLKRNTIFQDRITGFLNVPQRVKPVVFHIGETMHSATGRSKRSGHVQISVTLDGSHLPEPLANGTAISGPPIEHRIKCRVALAPGDQRQFENDVAFIPPRGVSVISDIDDTIKISQVAHRSQLLQNTFLNPFVTVPGMAQLYSSWAKEGIAFHYVSSSPWQLFRPLHDLLMSNGFPKGSFHLRSYRFGDPTVLKLFLARKRNKYNVIKSIFRMFPNRRFILIGDSGEKDPEIYGKVARKFPDQIERILVRRVEGRPWTRLRVAKAFRKIPKELWQSFRVPTQIKNLEIS